MEQGKRRFPGFTQAQVGGVSRRNWQFTFQILEFMQIEAVYDGLLVNVNMNFSKEGE